MPGGHDGRVVSLLEIMKEFAPDYIVHMIQVLLTEASNTPPQDARVIGPGHGFRILLNDLINEFDARSLTSAYDLLVRIRVTIDGGGLPANAIADLTPDLIRRIQDDMRRTLYLRLEPDESAYYRNQRPDWGEATTRFPIMEEVAEGNKCFALARYPATVFHMMRILEIGLAELSKEVHIPFEHKNWETIIRDIEAKVAEIDKSQPKGDREREVRRQKLHFYSEACRHFRFLKDAWRNYAMHVKETHDYSTALSTLIHTSEFMKQLAAKRPWEAT